MHLSSALFSASLVLGLAAAQSGMTVHVVGVGGANGSTVFQPSSIQANVGDMVQFQFYAKNHSVAQSTFNAPCTPMANSMPNATGFYAGYMPTNATPGDTTNVKTFTVPVTDLNPIWFYCPQMKHCQAGMVGAINAPASGNKTVQAFAALAASQTLSTTPGGNSTGGAAGAGASPAAGAKGSPTAGASSSSSPGAAQATANAGPKPLAQAAKQSLLGLGAGGLAALLLL